MSPHRPVTDEEEDEEEGSKGVGVPGTPRRGMVAASDVSFDQERRVAVDEELENTIARDDDDGGVGGRQFVSSSDAQEGRRGEDDELTSLTWLQNRNLLQTCIVGTDQSTGVATASSSSVHVPSRSESSLLSNGDVHGPSPSSPSHVLDCGGIQRGSLPSVVSLEFYNPTVHVCTKPPYSFSCLIFMAIEDSPNCALPVKDIYSWILSRFPYFQNAPTGWKNSVRHNLSLNKCFLKVDKGQNIAKGSLWCVDPEYRPNLIQALRKTPYNPYHHIRLPSDPPISSKLSLQNPVLVAGNGCTATSLVNSDLFPFLSTRLAASTVKDPEVDAAATMLALKNGSRILESADLSECVRVQGSRGGSRVISPMKERRERRIHEKLKVRIGRTIKPQPLSVCVPVITVSPTEDHTYSSTNSPTRHTTSDSPSSSIDEPFEFGGGSGFAAQRSPCVRGLMSTGHVGADGDSGGDSGVTRSATSESDDEYTAVVREFAEVIKEDSYERTPRVTPIRCPVIVRTVTSSTGSHCKVTMDDEEQQKIVDGADALLNLAGIRTHANESSVVRKRGKARRKRKLSRRHLRHLVSISDAHIR